MIGIYKITNKLNNKVYVGQSNNIERRFAEHKHKRNGVNFPIGLAIRKYGKENFAFEILEECSLEDLNKKEAYWIKKLNAYTEGYNCNIGGDFGQTGSQNGNSKLSEEEVILIRTAYNNRENQREVYEKYFAEKISFLYFQRIWQGTTWGHIMPEVFTKENKEYYIYHNSRGQNGINAGFSDEEVLKLRTEYIRKSAKELYEGYEDRVKFNTFQAMLWGRTYKNVPIYSKKQGKWID